MTDKPESYQVNLSDERWYPKPEMDAYIEALQAELDKARELIGLAISPMFDACGNSYINSSLEKWLITAKELEVYDGPTIGNIIEVKALTIRSKT